MTGPPCSRNPELMHDDNQVPAAKQVCAGCPVVEMCRQTAVDQREPWGVWGGLTVAERERHRAGQPVTVCAGCRLDCVPAAGNRCHQCDPGQIRGNPQSHLDADRYQLLVSLTVDRWPTQQIADLIGCPPRSVLVAQRRWGLAADPQKPSERTIRPHGTPAAVRRHQRRKEALCELCRQCAQRVQAEKWPSQRDRHRQLRVQRREAATQTRPS